jgi:hypothetical protein
MDAPPTATPSMQTLALLAEELAAHADRLARVARAMATVAPMTPAAPPRARALPIGAAVCLAEMEAMTDAWMRDRVANHPADRPIPTAADDARAAAIDLPGIPRSIIRAARWPGWRRGVGRPGKSAE